VREIDFGVDIHPDTCHISIPPYKMAPIELKVLNGLKDSDDSGISAHLGLNISIFNVLNAYFML